MNKYDAEEGYDRLMRVWNYLLKTYKKDDELPEQHWEAEELIKQGLWELNKELRAIALDEFKEERCHLIV